MIVFEIISAFCSGVYVLCRCKITGTKYSVGGHKFGMGYPTGYYKIRNGLRYYESGEIALSNHRNGVCKLLLTPKQLNELMNEEK
jgi:hypothetical protein